MQNPNDIHPDLLKLLTPTEYTPEELKVRAWYLKNAPIFLEELIDPWTPLEVAELAVNLDVGDRKTVVKIGVDYQWAVTGGDLEKCVIREIFERTLYHEDPVKNVDVERKADYLRKKFIVPLWKDHYANVITGEAA